MVRDSTAPYAAWLLVVAQFVSVIGTAATVVALPWLVIDSGRGISSAGLVMAAEVVPLIVLGPSVARVLGRRLSAVSIMIWCDLVCGALIMTVPWIAPDRSGSLVPLIVVVAACATLASPWFVAQRAVIAGVTSCPVSAMVINSRLHAAGQAGNVAGPILAGGVVALAGPTSVLLLNGATFWIAGILALAVAIIGTGAADIQLQRSSGRLRDVLSHPARGAIGTVMVQDGVLAVVCITASTSMGMQSGDGALTTAVTATALGVGAVIAALATPALLRAVSMCSLYRWSSAVALVPLWVLVVGEPGLVRLAVVGVVVGAMSGIVAASCMTVITELSREDAVGSDLFSWTMSACQASMAVGIVASGVLASMSGPTMVIGVAAGIGTLAGLGHLLRLRTPIPVQLSPEIEVELHQNAA